MVSAPSRSRFGQTESAPVVDQNLVAGKLVLPGFDGREGEVQAGLGVIVV